jgi:hypothetical protein
MQEKDHLRRRLAENPSSEMDQATFSGGLCVERLAPGDEAPAPPHFFFFGALAAALAASFLRMR